jgi:hypothetical protein
MGDHPNATAASVSGAVAIIAVAIIAAFVAIGPVVSAAATTVVIAAVLLVGAKGFKGAADRLWRGDGGA